MTILRDNNHAPVPASAAGARASERLTNAELLESLGVAVYITDAAGRITDYNEAAVELWGRRPVRGVDEWCGSWRLYWPDGAPMAHGECPMAIALKEGRPVRGGEAIAERPDGTRICFIAYPTPLRDEAGAVDGAVNVLVDITARKAAEHALHESEAQLTEALAVKDEFLGLLSHELKTPITVIMGNAMVLSRGRAALDEADRVAALDDISRESERLHAIIENLLVLARAKSPADLHFEPLVLQRIVARAVGEFGAKHPRRAFDLVCTELDALVYGDGIYVRQLLANLLSNAVKYSPEGSPITVEIESDGVTSATVRVCDRGSGIPEGECARIFDTFYRSPATSGAASGVGVGLAVCKRLVEAMGGAISASNRQGGGARIAFALPLALDAAD